MKLSEIAFDDIKIGQSVISAKGTHGKVTEKWLGPDRFDERQIKIMWENGNESMGWLCWMDNITVSDDKTT